MAAIHVLTLVDVEIAVGSRNAGRTATVVTGRVGKRKLLTEEGRIAITKAVQRLIGSFEADAVVVTRAGLAILHVVFAQLALIAGMTFTAEERLQVDATRSVLTGRAGTFVDVVTAISTGKASVRALAAIIVDQINALA